MKKIGLICAITALFMTHASLFANSLQNVIYVGVDGGIAAPTTAPTVDHFSHSNQNYVFGGTVGYEYAIDQKIATGVEANYTDLATQNYTGDPATGHATGSFKNSAIQILLTGTYLMDNGLNTFLKIGFAQEKTQFQLSNNAETGDLQKWIPAIAAGLGYDLIENLKFYGQYERTLGKTWTNATPANHPNEPMALNIFTMGLNYTLPL